MKTKRLIRSTPCALALAGLCALAAALPAQAGGSLDGHASVAVDCQGSGSPQAANHCNTAQASALARVRPPKAREMLSTRLRTRDTGAGTALGDYTAKASLTDVLTVVPARPEWDNSVSVDVVLGLHGTLKRGVLDIDFSKSSPSSDFRYFGWIGGPLPDGVSLIRTATGFRLDAIDLKEATEIHGAFDAIYTSRFGESFTQTIQMTTSTLEHGYSDFALRFAEIRLDSWDQQYGRLVAESGFHYPGPPMVPEPGTWALMAVGLAGVGWRARQGQTRRGD